MAEFKLIIFSLLLFCTSALGQPRSINIPHYENGDTAYWFKWHKELASKTGLPALDTISFKVYFRVWTNRQAIDIWQMPNGMFDGTLTTWTEERESEPENSTNRTFTIHEPLSEDTTTLLKNLFLSSPILNLPTGDSIKGWRDGNDGITYTIEHVINDGYSFKYYWTPKSQDSLAEAKLVQDFVDSALILANAENVWEAFKPMIPYRCYSNGGPCFCKPRIVTKKEFRKLLWHDKNIPWTKRLWLEITL